MQVSIQISLSENICKQAPNCDLESYFLRKVPVYMNLHTSAHSSLLDNFKMIQTVTSSIYDKKDYQSFYWGF